MDTLAGLTLSACGQSDTTTAAPDALEPIWYSHAPSSECRRSRVCLHFSLFCCLGNLDYVQWQRQPIITHMRRRKKRTRICAESSWAWSDIVGADFTRAKIHDGNLQEQTDLPQSKTYYEPDPNDMVEPDYDKYYTTTQPSVPIKQQRGGVLLKMENKYAEYELHHGDAGELLPGLAYKST